jgi:hypothetical protein
MIYLLNTKKIILCLIGIFIILSSTAFASPEISETTLVTSNSKIVIALAALIDHSQYKKVNTPIFEGLESKMQALFRCPPNSQLIQNSTINDGIIKSSGIGDIMAIEKSDLQSYCKENNVNYLVLYEITPITVIGSRGWVETNTATVTLRIKVFDANTGKYLYFDSLSAQDKQSSTGGWLGGSPSTIGPVRGAIEKIVNRLDRELTPIISQMNSKQ